MPDSPANLDHLVVGPSGVVVIDSKQWTRQSTRAATGSSGTTTTALTASWPPSAGKPRPSAAYWASRSPPLVCVHGAHIQRGGLHAQGVAVVPATLVRSALGHDQVLSDADVELLAATARTSLRPAA
jgi:Nuclease-related domain